VEFAIFSERSKSVYVELVVLGMCLGIMLKEFAIFLDECVTEKQHCGGDIVRKTVQKFVTKQGTASGEFGLQTDRELYS
jgi:hypothetical protein